MVRKAFSLFLVAIIVFGTLGFVLPTHSKQKDIERSVSIVNSGATKVSIDPQIYQSEGEIEVIIWFNSRDELNRFLRRYSDDIEVLNIYRIFPTVLIRGSKEQIIKISNINGVKGVFLNRHYKLAITWNDEDRDIKPTTYSSSVAIGADTFWNNYYNGSSIKIAIVDTGVDKTHPDLAGKVIAEKSFVLKKYGYAEDDEDPSDGAIGLWHGTRVAGVAAGAGVLDPENGTGVAPGAYILNAKVFPRGSVEEIYATSAGIIAAIEWAVENDADVINMSLGGGVLYYNPEVLAVEEAVKRGVTVVIAAGNEGDNGIATMSISSPGIAKSAITVGATDIDGTTIKVWYSSIGPSIYLAVKPDIAAPSGVIAPISTESGSYYGEAGEGTSFSAPHIAGAAALIAQYLKENGIDKKYWPGIIKALLMATANRPVGKYYELWAGAGFVNLTRAYERLLSAPLSPEGVPMLMSVLPLKVPTGKASDDVFFPYEKKVFRGMTLEFNFTIAISINDTIYVTFSGNITDAFNLHSSTVFTAHTSTTYWMFNATFKENAPEGYYEGEIIFSSSFDTIRVPTKFYLVEPKQRWLFDLKHTDWTIDFKYGQYKNFFVCLERNDISVEHWYYGSRPKSLDELLKYDLIFMPDTASYEPIYHQNGSMLGITTTPITDEEINTFLSYISSGGNMIIIGMTPESNNFTLLNKLTSHMGVYFKDEMLTTEPKVAGVIPGHILSRDVSLIPFYGVGLDVQPGVLTLARYMGTPVMAVYSGEKGGLSIIISTNFLFDNWAFEGKYAPVSGDEIEQFVTNILDSIEYQRLFFEMKVDKTVVSRGETINVIANVSESIQELTLQVTNYLGTTEYSMNYDPTEKVWTAALETTVAGDYGISVLCAVENGYWIHRGVKGSVEKSETEEPSIVIEPLNETITMYRDELSHVIVNVTITDNELLIDDPSLIEISSNVSMEISKTIINEKEIRYKLNISSSVIGNETIGQNRTRFTVLIKIKALDANLNEATMSALITVEITEKEIPQPQPPEFRDWTLILILATITIAIAILIVIYYMKRK